MVKSSEPIQIANTQSEHGPSVYAVVRAGYQIPLTVECRDCINADDVKQQLKRFPEGQFVALAGDRVVAMACTMRTSYSPEADPHSWYDAIGDKGLRNHDPAGEWLYGVEFSVHPDFRLRGIGRRLYEARFALVRRLNLRGFYAGGMLMGYYHYADQMSVFEYGTKVMRGEINDPTLSMQMKCGFEPIRIIENYVSTPQAHDTALLIVWRNPDHRTA